MTITTMMLCGCGAPGRYQQIDEDGNETASCNRYARCLTYDELRLKAQRLEIEARIYHHYLNQIVSVNATDYEYKAWAKTALDEITKSQRGQS